MVLGEVRHSNRSTIVAQHTWCPAASKDNAEAYKAMVSGVKSDADATLLFDPQTSGGLLVALPEQRVGPFLEAMKGWRLGSKAIGPATARGAHAVVVR